MNAVLVRSLTFFTGFDEEGLGGRFVAQTRQLGNRAREDDIGDITLGLDQAIEGREIDLLFDDSNEITPGRFGNLTAQGFARHLAG